MDIPVDTLKQLFDVGGVVVVTVMLWLVWNRLNQLTDRMLDLLDEMRLAGVIRGTETRFSAAIGRESEENET